jgi:hypothetical protein
MKNTEGLIKSFDKLKNALKTCDTKCLNQMILEEYKGFSLNGTIEVKDDILMFFKPGGIKLSKYEVLEVEYEVFNEIGIVSGKGFISGSYDGHKFQHKVLFMDIFKYVDGNWRYFKSQVTEIQSE